jgi:hypothetical protein
MYTNRKNTFRKKPWVIVLLVPFVLMGAMVPFHLHEDSIYRTVVNNDFAKGERFSYRVHYLGMSGGVSYIQMDTKTHQVNGRPCFRVNVEGKTVGVASMFYHVNDLWRSYIDSSAITTQKFYRKIEEGKSYRMEETTVFDHRNKKAKLYQKKRDKEVVKDFSIPDNPQDIISGYYYLRTIDYENKLPGEVIVMKAVYEDSVYDFKVKYLGKEVVKTKVGKINAFAMSPIMPENKLFDGGDAITFWVSDDKNRVPLLVKAKMFIGAVNVELENYSGLKHEFNFAKK